MGWDALVPMLPYTMSLRYYVLFWFNGKYYSGVGKKPTPPSDWDERFRNGKSPSKTDDSSGDAKKVVGADSVEKTQTEKSVAPDSDTPPA